MVFFGERVVGVAMVIRVNVRRMGVKLVFFGVFWWGVRDEAWMNNVIIPDENARTIRNGNQADFLSLNIIMAMIRDSIVIEIAIFSGFIDFSVSIIMMVITIVTLRCCLLIYKINVSLFLGEL